MSLRGKIITLASDGGGPSLDTMLATFDKELENFRSLVLPAPESKPRTPFDSTDVPIEKMSMSNMSTRQLMTVLPIMLPLVANMRASSKLYDGKFHPKQSEVTPEFVGEEALTALLNNAGQAFQLFGRPKVSTQQIILWIADWIGEGGETLGKPTHYEVRDGKY